MPMLRPLTAVSLVACLAAGPAAAQFFGFGQPYQQQPWQQQPWQQRQPQFQTQPQFQPQPPKPGLPALPGQPKPGQAQTPPSAAPVPPQIEAAPYDRDLQRLSEILGALHFLRGICPNYEGQNWRAEAQTLIDAEAPAGNRHDQMMASFNRGYRGFQQSYRSCTPAAGVVMHRYLQEGASIAREITARYAN
jgi:uncharacterized protein (TIGR02301 family)